jgi:Skp family chaperone for outer membrane proteins
MTNIRAMNTMNMKIGFTAGLLLLAMAAGIHVALAQEKSKTINIVVVDVQYLMENSSAAKTARAEIEKMQVTYRREIEGKLGDVTKAYQSLAQERSRLSEEAYQQRMQELRQKAANYQGEAQERLGKLDVGLRGGLQKIAAAVEGIVNDIMKEQKLSVVLPRSSIIGTPAVPDLTQEILKRLNRRIPSVFIDIPK